MERITIPAVSANLDTVLSFVDSQMQTVGCTPKFRNQVQLAVEEIFTNVARYAYCPGTGDVSVGCEVSREPCGVTVTFSDTGKPYNPLQRQDPDLSLNAEEREIGGLGILLVKKVMDQVHYEFRDGRNCLTLQKQA